MTTVRAVAAASLLLAAAALASGCGGTGQGAGDPSAAPPRLGAEVVQLRRDEVLGRVEIEVTNRSDEQVVVDTLELRVPGFAGGGPQRAGEPMPPGRVVNLPTPYGEVSCPGRGEVAVGRPRVVLRVTTASEPTTRRVVLRPRDPQHLLRRIAASTCLTQRLQREVALSFAEDWRQTGSGTDGVLHGTLRARLTTDQPRDVTQLAGTVMFDLRPDGAGVAAPLAHLTPQRPEAAIPVAVSVARCDGHTRGEIKKPFAFLVWIGPPGGEQRAVTPQVTDADGADFRRLCPF